MFTGDSIYGVGLGTWSEVGWENVNAWKRGSLCMRACEWVAYGGMSNLKLVACPRISRAPQPLSSERLLQGFLLLNLRVTCVAEQMFFITSERSQLSFSGHSPWRTEQGWGLSFQRTGLRFRPEFMVLGPDSQQLWQELLGFVAWCHLFPSPFPSLRLKENSGRAESSELPAPLAIPSTQSGSLRRGVLATEFFLIYRERGWRGHPGVMHGLGHVPGSRSSKWPFRFVPLAAPS